MLQEDLKELAKKLNPLVGFYDPLRLSDANFWGFGQEATIGWLQHAEIKHGRVAMAAFVGYCVQCNFNWPWAMTLDGTPFPSHERLSPPEQWDALPLAGKLQILLFIGFLEWYSELSPGKGAETGLLHYTKGGVPGKYPSFKGVPHWAPDLYDPLGLARRMNEGQRRRRLRVEINHGRLAMLAIMAFLCEQKIPGSVPYLNGMLPYYDGEVMAPLEGNLILPEGWFQVL
jgi:Chlorophyll A-B binding protein